MKNTVLRSAFVMLVLVGLATGLPDYTGYSGAPGTRGSCARDCHGSSGGTIVVEGFPASYQLGQTYQVKVKHNGGRLIVNFNGSVRVGTGTQIAGTLTAGLNSAIYSATGEPSGVHLSASDKDSCIFSWTAPASGVGDVRLYIAGLQGSVSGPNTELEIVSSQGAGVEELPPVRVPVLSVTPVPSIVTDNLVLRVETPDGAAATARVIDRSGRVIAELGVPTGGPERMLAWEPVDTEGARLAPGVYFVTLECNAERRTRKFAIQDR